MVGGHLQRLVHQGVGADGVRPAAVSARNHVPEVAIDGIDKKALAPGIPVMSPGVGSAVAEWFKNLAERVVAPDATSQRDGVTRYLVGAPHTGKGRSPRAAIEPAVRPPAQAVGEVVVAIHGHIKPLQHHLRWAIRLVIVIAVRDEQESRWTHQPDTAQANLDTGESLEIVEKDPGLFGNAIAVVIAKDNHPIPLIGVEPDFAFGISVVLRHPQLAGGVVSAGDGVADNRLSREDIHPQSFGHAEAAGRLLGRHGFAGILFAVFWGGKAVLPGGQGEASAQERHHHAESESGGERSSHGNLAGNPGATRMVSTGRETRITGFGWHFFREYLPTGKILRKIPRGLRIL